MPRLAQVLLYAATLFMLAVSASGYLTLMECLTWP